MNRRAAALRFRDHLNDLRQQRFRSNSLGTHRERAGLIDRAADYLVTCAFAYRHWLACNHRFVDVALAFDDHTVYGHLFPGPHTQQVAFLNGVHRNLFLLAVADAMRSFRRKAKQGFDCLPGAAARFRLDQLA